MKSGVVKEYRTSQYYGVRLDKRIKNEVETIWYRTHICLENKKYDLGLYNTEQMAAYAFNLGFNLFSNSKYIIENKVNLTSDETKYVQYRFEKFKLKHGLSK